MRRSLAVVAVVVLLVGAGCAGAPDRDVPTPRPTETTTVGEPSQSADAGETPTARATPTPTVAPTTSPSPGPTRTATEATAATRTATPTATPATDGGTAWRVEVLRVVDGDTFEVALPDGHTETVRLLGVDTPEVHVRTDPDEFEGIPDTADGRDWLRGWGHRASEFARANLVGETVRIATDPEADRRGSYGRLLVYVHDDGRNFNLALLRQGYARLYDAPFSLRSEFRSSEAAARRGGVGLWNYEAPETTATTAGGGVAGRLAVASVHADAAGDDHDNLTGEWVVLENAGDAELDLAGWSLRDEAGHTYRFPDGVTLAPGETVTVYTGDGTDSPGERYWGAGGPVWNNGGDTVIVRDDEGDVVVEYGY